MTVYNIGYQSPTNPLPSKEHLDGDPALVEMIDKTPQRGLVIRPGREALIAGRAVDPAYLPKTMMIKNGMVGVTDFDGYSSVLFISGRFKAIVEKLEPDVHQFFPLTLVDRKKRYLADHWVWVICVSIDTVDSEASNWEFRNECRYHAPANEPSRLIFSKTKMAGHHFWREKCMMRGHFRMVSEEAAEMMQAAELTGLTYRPWETK